MTGHAQGAAGVLETIYSILMLENNFIAPSINIDNLDPAVMPTEIARQLKQKIELDTVMTNSFGFGGTNGSMLLSKLYE